MENKYTYIEIEPKFWQNIKLKERLLLFDHIANMIAGGINIMKALESFVEKVQNPLLKTLAQNIAYFLNGGNNLSTSMKKLPLFFEKYEVAIIEAGENSGKLENALRDLSNELRQGLELKNKVKGAMTYPIIIMVFLVIAIIVVMSFVVPQMLPLFEQGNIELPLSTKMLIGVSNFFTNNGTLLFISFITTAFGVYSYSKSTIGKRFFDNMVLSLPLVGLVYKNYVLSRIAANLALLLGGGIPVIKTISLAGIISNNLIYEDTLDMVAQKVEKGQKIAEGLENTDPNHVLFTMDFIQVIESGEKTGTIDKVGKRLSEQYAKEVDYSLSMVLKWIEPIAIFIAGLFVLWFALSIYSALLQITQGVI